MSRKISTYLPEGNYQITMEFKDQSPSGCALTAWVYDSDGREIGQLGPLAQRENCSQNVASGAMQVLRSREFKRKVKDPDLYEKALNDLSARITTSGLPRSGK